MVRILIVDDTSDKLRRIRGVVARFPEINADNIVCVSTSIDAKRLMVSNCYDLLILDINIPERPEDLPSAETGMKLLNELKNGRRLKKPYHILGITAYEHIKESKNKDFEALLWYIIKYDESNVEWEKILENKIEYLIQSKKDLLSTRNSVYEYDLGIITALGRPELEAILKLPANWISFKQDNDTVEFHKGIFEVGSNRLNVICACSNQMGMVASSVLTGKMINYFQPRYIAMTGIGAGLRSPNTGFGDILAAEISFDYDSGKISKVSGKDVFSPDHRQIQIDADLSNYLKDCQTNRKYLDSIFKDCGLHKPNTVLNLHIGPVASGARVISSDSFINALKAYQRKLIGIDMETYGVYFAAENSFKPRPIGFLSIKSISDFGGEDKGDEFQNYAAYTSANFLYQFSLEYLRS